MGKEKTIMSVDLEHDWGSKETKNLTEIVPDLLDFFDDHDIKATFFVVGELAYKFENLIKEISRKHEIGSHSFSHPNLKTLSESKLETEILVSKKSLEEVGVRVLGFRSPMVMFPKNLGYYLRKHGYIYDSSVSCSFFPGRYSNLLSKPEPYFASDKDLKEKGKDILELPLPGFTPFRMPFGFPFIRLFYPVSLWKLKPRYMFYMHPCEFLKKPPGKGDSFLVRKFYGRNRGKKAWQIFEDFINKMDVNFISCRDFIKIRFPDLL